MKSVFHLAVFISTLTLCSSALAGVQIGATRIIYPEKNDEAQLSVKSQNTTISHLVQAWVSNIDDQGEPPFIATPPIIKLGANQETIFHFIYAKKGLNCLRTGSLCSGPILNSSPAPLKSYRVKVSCNWLQERVLNLFIAPVR